MALIAIILCFFGTVITAFALYVFYRVKKNRKLFESQGVPYMGSGTPRMLRAVCGVNSLFEVEQAIYTDAMQISSAENSPLVGFTDFFVLPGYFVTDLDLARNIYVKNFDFFENRRKFNTDKSDILVKKMLVALESEEWKWTRSKLSPTFTTGKIRRMFAIFERSSQRMCNFLKKSMEPNGDFDISDAYSKYAMDVIATCSCGVDSKSFQFSPGVLSEFEEMGQRFQFKFSFAVFVKFLVIFLIPKLADILGLKSIDMVPQLYFMRIIKEVMKHRRATGERQDDFLQLMMDTQKGLLKSEENTKETLEVMTGSEDSGPKDNSSHFTATDSKMNFEDDDIVANCLLFLSAGFDTTQSLLLFAAYALSLEQKVQEKLYQEVASAYEENGGKLTYDSVHGMSYLDMFVNETLRYYPPASRTERACTKDYKVPGTEIVIEKGTLVILPLLGVLKSDQYYDNPEKFDPEHFHPEKKSGRHPYAFPVFGHGPRNCIGMRFALTKAKAAIAALVYNFKLQPCSRTDIPMKYGNNNITKPKNGMWLNFTPRAESVK